jgi:hypothetical protein
MLAEKSYEATQYMSKDFKQSFIFLLQEDSWRSLKREFVCICVIKKYFFICKRISLQAHTLIDNSNAVVFLFKSQI